MLSVILIWCYMLMTTFLVGYGILRIITHRIPYQIRHMDSYLFCGLVGVTVYAQFFSLICKVGLLANLILCTVCIVIVWFDRKALGSKLKVLWSDIKRKGSGKRGRMLVILFLFLLFAYGTSRGIIHYDTGLYHAQSIRWLEEYGVVKGLGNLHCRLAYNSSSFALSALYSMSFVGGQSYHCCAGFLAFLLAKVCLEIADSIRKGRLRIGDFARVMCVYYLVIIFDEMVSPASDYFMVLTAFYIVIRWLDLLEQQEDTVLPYALLCVLGVFLMTIKLSAALILLLVVHPAYYLMKDKKWREIGRYLFLGILTALPYFIRNVLLSGWLVYPFTQIDIFNVPWKISKGMADYDAREIQVYGRGYTDVAQFDKPIWEWLPGWFQTLAGSDKLLVLAAGCSVCILLVWGLMMLWKRSGVSAKQWQILLVQVTVAGSFLFWLGTSPLIRYGCVYVYLTSAVVLGGIYDRVMNQKVGYCGSGKESNNGTVLWKCRASKLCTAVVALFVGYKLCALGQELVQSYTNDYWLTQKDYDNYEVISYQIEGITFYYPVQGDRVGYEAFPSSPTVAQIGFIGENIADGFYGLQQE